MSEPQQAFVVMPVDASTTKTHVDGEPDQATKIAQAIQQSLHVKAQSLEDSQRHEPPPAGPLKEMIANQDSLYKYINWEDPARTIGSFVIVLSVLLGAHYIPLTSWFLKSAATVFGVVSIFEGSNRALSRNTMLSRMRPMEYKTVPESTLNATLHDIHDFVQVAVVKIQRMLYGEDLSSSFLAFIGATVTYQLLRIASPFWLAVICLVGIYTAPLIASPQGRRAARDAKQRAEEIAQTTVDQSRMLAQDGKAKASELTTKAQESVTQVKNNLGDMATSLGESAQNVTQGGQQLVQDMAGRASETTSDISGAAAENIKKLPGASADTARGVAGTVKGYASDLTSGTLNKASQVAGSGQHSSGAVEDTTATKLGETPDASRIPLSYATSSDYHLASGDQTQTTKRLPHGVAETTPRIVGDNLGSGMATETGGAQTYVPPSDILISPIIPVDRTAKRALRDVQGDTTSATHSGSKRT